MFLSKRWKFLWTMVPKLDFIDGYGAEDYDDDEYTRFRQYVDRFMELHKSPALETLKFKTGLLSTTDDMATWIEIAIVRDLRELEISRFSEEDDDYDSFTLPTCLYTYQNLVVLKLKKRIVLDVPLKVSLSSLKTLHFLSVHYKNEECQRRLLAGCPVLEELAVANHDRDLIEAEPDYFHQNAVINVPTLKYLHYVDIFDYGHLCTSENMPELVEANVKLVCDNPESLMRSLTSVKRLSLCLHGSTPQHCNGFYQLVYLELCGCGPTWWHLLTWMLENSPKLQVLKLNKCEERYLCSIEPIKGGWRQPTAVPECLQLHLSTFEWKDYNGRKEENKLAAYILKNARHLKTAKFSIPKVYGKKIEAGKRKKLVSLRRASCSCQLLVD